MSIYFKRIPFLSCIIFCVFISACKKFVEVTPPITQQVTTTVFNDNSSATAALTIIYSQMVNNTDLYTLPLNTGLASDELMNYSNNISISQFYTNALNAAQSPGPWVNAYRYIYEANAVIEGLQLTVGVTPSVAKQLIGEAKFIRAFWFFYLVNLYGDVPLVTTTDYNVNKTLSRTSKPIVYNQIVSDLNDAITQLSPNYVDARDTVPVSARVRPNQSAALALLSRAYLYLGNYSNAESKATTLINNSATYSLKGNLDSVFLADNSEAIWQLAMPLPSNYNTTEGAYFILVSTPSSGGTNCATITDFLLQAFELGDKRKQKWISNVIVSGNTYYFPYKYKIRQTAGGIISENSTLLRLAEQYLIRAEARVKQNNFSGAVADLNVIRNRAGLPNYSGLVDEQNLLTAILHERQVELFTEYGHRWLDLKRTNSIDTVMGSPRNVSQAKGGSWASYKALFPLPQTERVNDPNLSQNPQY